MDLDPFYCSMRRPNLNSPDRVHQDPDGALHHSDGALHYPDGVHQESDGALHDPDVALHHSGGALL